MVQTQEVEPKLKDMRVHFLEKARGIEFWLEEYGGKQHGWDVIGYDMPKTFSVEEFELIRQWFKDYLYDEIREEVVANLDDDDFRNYRDDRY